MAHDLTKASVALCIGKDCRRRAEFDDLHSLLTGHSDDEIVLAMIRSRKERRDLRRSIVSGRALSERLERRTVTGSKRRTALRRLHRSLRRYH